jgi:oxygen-independent coproporphyrinogen III oxidase
MSPPTASPERIRRRNIHTYPFKYRHLEYDDFFSLESGVLYVHIPFCLTKCGFCDYTVYVGRGEDARQTYVEAIEREIRAWPTHRFFPEFALDAIYFGGGTPGILSGQQLARLIAVCRETFELRPGCEICIEFDPSTVTPDKLQRVREAGATRLSVGVQSFDPKVLETCGRSHDTETAVRAIEQIRGAGFGHLNVDLIFPLPDQTVENWAESVDQAISLDPGCITAYGLEVWPKTAFHHQLKSGKITLPDANDELRMFEYALDALEDAGYLRCSTSGYYHPDRCAEYSRFLEYYWRTWPMIGVGVSSKTVVHDRLYTNVKPLNRYYELVDQGRIPLDFATRLTRRQEMRRVMIRGLKMCEVFKGDFMDRFGVEMRTVYGDALDDLVEKGLLIEDEERFALTRQGQLLSTNVFEYFYAEEDLSPPEPGEVRFGISELVD